MLGYSFSLAEGWSLPDNASQPGAPTMAGADAMHALLVRRADTLEGCTEGSEEAEMGQAHHTAQEPRGRTTAGEGGVRPVVLQRWSVPTGEP